MKLKSLMYKPSHNFIKLSLLNNQIVGAVLILVYCLVYGITAQVVLSGIQMMFFLGSFVFALSTLYIRDQQRQKEKLKKGILFNQIAGTVLVFAYLIVYGITSTAIMNGFQLIFFMSSFTFVLSLFYIHDPERIKKEESVSSSNTSSPFAERNPCFINNNDLSWLIRALNSNLSTIIGFSELMLQREYNEREREYMIRNIYDQSVSMTETINKAYGAIPDSPANPKKVHEVVDLLSDKNFK